MSREESFRAAISAHGIEYSGELYFDGRLHRFKANGDNARNCWYVLYNGPIAVGAFGCWKRGIKETWCERDGNLSLVDSQAVRACRQEAALKLKTQTVTLQRKARELAAWILSRSTPARSVHPYLERKRVKVFGDMREYRGALVLPLRDEAGELHSLQFIGEDGDKKFLRGGRVAGCFFALADKADGLLVLCEGYSTGATIHEATGHAVFCCMNSGNLLEVAKALRALWPQREITIAADNDQWTDGNPGLTKANAAAKAIHARLAVPRFKDNTSKPTDFNDLAALESSAVVREQLSATQTPKESDEETYARLAALSPADYDRAREAEADKLGCRVATLDSQVQARRPRTGTGGGGENLQGVAVKLVDVEPWPEPVDGAEVLDAISRRFDRYVVMPEGAADMDALWCAHTYMYRLFQKSPRLYFSAPTEECGKSTLCNVTSLFCARAKRTDNMTTAVMFRLVSGHSPTILADECDKWLFNNLELVGLVQSGHEKGGTVMRCEGDSNDLREFGCYGPFVMAALGKLPSQLHSRSICIRLSRASKEEIRKRVPFDFANVEYERELNRKLARWINDNRERIASAEPVLPERLFNRIADNWRPLFKIAAVAGGKWLSRCAEAFSKLTTIEDERENLRVMLLTDIQKVFNGEWPPPLTGQPPVPVEHIFSKDLIDRLAEMKERPWPEVCRNDKPITARWLARNLGAFGIHSSNIWDGEKQVQAKGYERAQFDNVFAKYIPEDSVSVPNPLHGGNLSVQPSNTKVKAKNLSVQQDDLWTDKKRPIYEAIGRLDVQEQGLEEGKDKEDDVSGVTEPQPGEESPPEGESLSGDLRL